MLRIRCLDNIRMYSLMKIKNKSNYCPYPFSQMTTTPHGYWKLCCSAYEGFDSASDYAGKVDFKISTTSLNDYWNGDYLNWVRKQHLAGIPIKECLSCKEYESFDIESYRERAIKERGFLDDYTETPISMDLKLGNRCNAACLFCDPTSSSLIQKEWTEIGWDKSVPFSTGLTGKVDSTIFDQDYNWPESQQFWDELKSISANLENLKFTGGEPLINPYLTPYLYFLVEKKYSQNIRLQVTTNGIKVPPKFIQLLPYFKEVQINFSVDGVGKRNEYIRYPTNWNRWLKNLELVSTSVGANVELCLQHSYSFYSLFYLDEIMEFIWNKKRFGFHQFKVNHPHFQRPELLDTRDREIVLDRSYSSLQKLKLQSGSQRDDFLLKEYQGIIKIVESLQDHSHDKPLLKNFLITLDKKRNRRIHDFMPLSAQSLGITEADYE
jgi:pyruvate-formate lyase-activating enzyme